MSVVFPSGLFGGKFRLTRFERREEDEPHPSLGQEVSHREVGASRSLLPCMYSLRLQVAGYTRHGELAVVVAQRNLGLTLRQQLHAIPTKVLMR